MLNGILQKNSYKIEEGEVITPIDTFKSGNCFFDEELTHKIKGVMKFSKGDEFEVQILTPREVVCYVKNKDFYIVLQNYDLDEFEDLN